MSIDFLVMATQEPSMLIDILLIFIMPDYTQLVFHNVTTEQSEILIAELNEAGFEGFEEIGNELKAFIVSDELNEEYVHSIAERLDVKFSKSIIEQTNWNQVWESNFQPVLVDDYVSIRAHFHEAVKGVKHEIIITPKMSFGTGHHATTYMMIQQMESIEMKGRSVLDFGTGTGVLAILAKKSGAATVTAIDNDDWSMANAQENILQNDCSSIILQKADSAELDQPFDIILANINKNVILDNFYCLAKQLAPGGVLLLSGLLTDDEKDIRLKANSEGLGLNRRIERHNWLSLRLSWQ